MIDRQFAVFLSQEVEGRLVPVHLVGYSDSPMSGRTRARDPVQRVLEATAARFFVKVGDLTGADRSSTLVLARHVAIYVARTEVKPTPSYPELGRLFGHRDHTSVMSAVKRITAMVTRVAFSPHQGDVEVLAHVEAIRSELAR